MTPVLHHSVVSGEGSIWRQLLLLRTLCALTVTVSLAAAFPAFDAVAQAQTDPLDSSLAEVRTQIRAADTDRAQYGSGLILTQIELRLSVLRSTEAMLDQKRLALLHGISVVWHDSVPSRGLTQDERERIAREAEAARAQVTAAEREAALYSGGLIQTMALVRVATAKVTLAVLDEQRVLAEAGIPLRLPVQGTQPSGAPAGPGQAASDRDALR